MSDQPKEKLKQLKKKGRADFISMNFMNVGKMQSDDSEDDSEGYRAIQANKNPLKK